MAAIDKLWIRNYDDLDDLRRWAIIYYPKLFTWLNTSITKEEAEHYKRKRAAECKEVFETQWERASADGSLNSAIAHFKSLGYSDEDATFEATELQGDFRKSLGELYEEISFSVMNTPLKVDRKLKWICPVPCVREYLQKQCGVKEHWYYKLFWRGKKYFSY